LTDFKPLVKRIRNNIVPLIAVVGTDLDKLKACVIVAVKLYTSILVIQELCLIGTAY
jgi:hypothetical protein